MLFSRGFLNLTCLAFDSNGERPVSGTGPLWFRKCGRVEAPFRQRRHASIENLRRIESNAFFTNFRRINLNANTGDLSTAASNGTIARDQAQRDQDRRLGSRDVFSAPYGILARARARAAAARQDSGIGKAAAD